MNNHYEDIAEIYRRPAATKPANPRHRLTGSALVTGVKKRENYAGKYAPRETDIVRSILDGLAACGVMAWRANTGAVTGHHHGKSRFIRFGPKGQADIVGLWYDGRFLAIEVKRPGGKLSEDQLNWLHRVSAAGGIAFIAHSWTEVEQHLWGKGKP